MRRRRTSEAPRQSPLTTTQLSDRRATLRRRRTRRRLGVALALLVAGGAAVVVAVLLSAGSPGQAPVTHASLGSSPPVVPRRSATPRHRPVHDPYRSVGAVLGYTSYVRLAGSRRREVALTFDDGPGPYTSAIIRILRRTHTPATFFVIGRQVGGYRHVIGLEARDGFDIGDHTESHPMLSRLSASAQQDQVLEDAHAIQAAGAPYPRLFRPPYGAFDAATLDVLRAARMLIVLWSVDTSDYARPGVARIVYVALSGLRPGAIILFHDGGGDRHETVQALPRILRGLRRRGYRAVTVAQLVADDPPPHGQPPPRALTGRG